MERRREGERVGRMREGVGEGVRGWKGGRERGLMGGTGGIETWE